MKSWKAGQKKRIIRVQGLSLSDFFTFLLEVHTAVLILLPSFKLPRKGKVDHPERFAEFFVDDQEHSGVYYGNSVKNVLVENYEYQMEVASTIRDRMFRRLFEHPPIFDCRIQG